MSSETRQRRSLRQHMSMLRIIVCFCVVTVLCYAPGVESLAYIVTVAEADSSSSAISSMVSQVHGIPKSKHLLYRQHVQVLKGENGEEGFVFTCLDGNGRIPITAINDDYCDCKDGSDEPGSAACSVTGSGSTWYYCVNPGYRGRYIFASRVRDGVCDCCDGSDEKDNPDIHCTNRCEAEEAKYLKEHAARIRVLQEGAQAKAEYVRKSQEYFSELDSKLAELNDRISQLEIEKETLEERKQEAEKIETEEKEAAGTVNVDTIAAHLGLAELERSHLHNVLIFTLQHLLRDKSLFGKKKDSTIARVFDQSVMSERRGLGLGPSQLATQCAIEESDGTDTADFGENDDEDEVEKYSHDSENEERALEGGPKDVAAEERARHDAIGGSSEDASQESMGEEGFAPVNVDYDKFAAALKACLFPAKAYINDEAERVRSELRRVEADLAELQQEAKGLQEDADQTNFGDEREFWPLKNRCFELRQQQYTYSVCLFQSAKQDRLSLGTFDRVTRDDTPDGAYVMHFTRGQGCWQGPQRSLALRMLCGLTEEVAEIEEPSKCVYKGVFYTPAACPGSASPLDIDDSDGGSDRSGTPGSAASWAHEEL